MKAEKPEMILCMVVSRQCNIRCSFCYQDSFSTKCLSNEILYEKLRPIYEQAKFCALVGGELTCLPNFLDYLVFLRKNYPHMDVLMGTNGLLFDERWISVVEEYGIIVNFSLNASGPKPYEKILSRGDPGLTYSRIKANLLAAVDAQNRSKRPIINNISMVVTPETQADIRPFALLGLELGLNVFFRFPVNQEVTPELEQREQEIFQLQHFFKDYIKVGLWHHPSRNREQEIKATFAEDTTAQDRCLQNLPFTPKQSLSQEILTYESFIQPTESGCPLVEHALALLPEGWVSPCFDMPGYFLGHAGADDLAEILSGENRSQIQKQVKSSNYHYCFPRCPMVTRPETCVPGAAWPVDFSKQKAFQAEVPYLEVYRAGRFHEAAALLEQVRAGGRELPHEARHHYARALGETGREEAALAEYEALLSAPLGPLEFWVRWGRGRLLLKLNRIDEARADLVRAAALDSEHEEVRAALVDLEERGRA